MSLGPNVRILIIGIVVFVNAFFVWPQLAPLSTFQNGTVEIEPGEAMAWAIRGEISEDEINLSLIHI